MSEPTPPTRRKLPRQQANEERMIAATIELLHNEDVATATNARIAAAAGTIPANINRYFGGRDLFLSAVADAIGTQIAEAIDLGDLAIDIAGRGIQLSQIMKTPLVQVWLKLFRHLSGREDQLGQIERTTPRIRLAMAAAMRRRYGFSVDESDERSLALLILMVGSELLSSQLLVDDEMYDRIMDRVRSDMERAAGWR